MKKTKELVVGWKNIAAYLSCSVMTAHRRVQEGLPVFRVGGSVRAYAEDLDAWMASRVTVNVQPLQSDTPGLIVKSRELPPNLLSLMGRREDERVAIIPLGPDVTLFRAEERRRRRAEEKYDWLFERVPVWIWELDVTGVYTNSNLAVKDILGYDAEELKGYAPAEFLVYDEDVAAFSGEINALFEKARIVRGMRTRFCARDGSLRWLETDCEPFYDENGSYAGVRGVSRDISYRVLLEKEAAEARRYLESVLMDSADAIITVDLRGRINIWNEGAASLFDVSREQARRRSFAAVTGLVPPETTFEVFLERIRDHGGKLYREAVPVESARRPGLSVAATYSLVTGTDGEVVGLSVIARDVTERERYEGALKAAAEEWQNTFDAVEDAIIVTDQDRRIILCNRAAQERFGVGREEVFRVPCYRVVHGSDRPPAGCPAGEVPPPRAVFLDTTREAYYDVNVSRITVTGEYVCVLRDVTERHRAEEALRASEETSRALLNAPTNTAILIDVHGTILALNDAALERIQEDRETIVGLSIYDVLPDELVWRRKEEIAYVRRTGRPVYFEDARQKTGRVFENNIYPVFGADGEVCRLAIFARDVTDRKVAERTMAERERLFRLMVERSFDAMVVFDAQGYVADCNDNLCRLWGRDREEIISKHITEIEQGAEFTAVFYGLAKGTKTGVVDFEMKLGGGREGPSSIVKARSTAISDGSAGFVGAIFICQMVDP